MRQNAYLLARIGADTAENERDFAEKLPKIGNYLTGPLPRSLRALLRASLEQRADRDWSDHGGPEGPRAAGATEVEASSS